MNSISRAVSSKLNGLANKRQRLVGETVNKDTEITNPSWTDPTTSEFNYFEPPTLLIPEEDWRETPILQSEMSPDKSAQKSPTAAITKKVSSVVRKLSPFGNNNNNQIVAKDSSKENEMKTEDASESEKKKMFKETRGKMDKLKKSFKSKDREQLIESDED